MRGFIIFSILAATCYSDSRVVEFHDFGETVSLECTLKKVMPHNETYVRHWVVPDYKEVEGEIMMLANETRNMSSTWLESDGWTLHIGWIRHVEMGKYSCIWQEGGEEQMSDIELNFIPPSQWSIYKDNVTVGLIATAGFIALIIVIFLVYYFRWQDPIREDARLRFTSNGVEQRVDSAYENPSYIQAEQMVHRNPTVTESKM